MYSWDGRDVYTHPLRNATVQRQYVCLYLSMNIYYICMYICMHNNNNNNNNYDNLYGAVTRPYHYKGASQATKQSKL